MIAKAKGSDFQGRFREIISDPLNLLIKRDLDAGTISNDCVILHNGNRVAYTGPEAYYDGFSEILVLNRGVHEPLEEYVFQEVLSRLPADPSMLELGAYWGHYSMWLKKFYPNAQVFLVEPEAKNLEIGRNNFKNNGYQGIFLQAFVGEGQFSVDQYLQDVGIDRLTILHSDIQGFEKQMLEGARATLEAGRVDYLFISTHSQDLHQSIERRLAELGYRVEISSDYLLDTTSYDGFIFASQPDLQSLFSGWSPLGRTDILRAVPRDLLLSLLSRGVLSSDHLGGISACANSSAAKS